MKRERALLAEIYCPEPGLRAGRLHCPASLIPAPGQFVMALSERHPAAHRTPLFPAAIHDDGFSTLMVPEVWQPGAELDLMGPFGRGVMPPGASSRWLFISSLPAGGTLLPLGEMGLERGLELAWWGASGRGLDPAVEIILDLDAGLDWSDYTACETDPETIEALRAIWRSPPAKAKIEVLVLTDLLCGFGACQACAVTGRRGYRLGCSDGPVFDAGWLGASR